MKYFSRFKEHYTAIIRLGIPIVIGQLGIVIVGLADNIMVGHYAYFRSGSRFLREQCIQYSDFIRTWVFLRTDPFGRTVFR